MDNFPYINLAQTHIDSARKRSGSPILSDGVDIKRPRPADITSGRDVYGK